MWLLERCVRTSDRFCMSVDMSCFAIDSITREGTLEDGMQMRMEEDIHKNLLAVG
jgi:hypothetical protein